MAQTTFDLDDVKRRMQGALQSFKGDMAGIGGLSRALAC